MTTTGERSATERIAAMLTLHDFERAAHALLDPSALGYFRSGADAERTLRANERAYRRWEVWHRVLVDVSAIDASTTVLGTPVPSPVLIAPTAYHRLAHPDGEAGTARAAARAGTVMIVSTLATTALEDIAAAAPGATRWFQLYVHKDRAFSTELVQRAAAAGYRALVLTVDTPVLGRRLADERQGFALPAGMRMENLGPLLAGANSSEASMLARFVASRHDASLSWRDLDWLRSLSPLPLVLKGVVRADDAARAASAGVDGIVVSNHGARQLDGSPATLDALPGVVEAVAGRLEVYLDGGVRWGTDVLKALALGARAVLLGRPILWGLAVGGEAGVSAVLACLDSELRRAMALAACPTLASIDRDLVKRRTR
jgi:4-hydroxymandelate oxidase